MGQSDKEQLDKIQPDNKQSDEIQPDKEQSDDKQSNKKKHKRWSIRKIWAVSAVAFALIALLVIPVFAWLYVDRSVETMAKINLPYALRIGAGDAEQIAQLELNNIDVSGDQKSKDVVFCVYSTQENKEYDLQLAHTTNIGFKFQIEKASKSEDGTISYLNDKYTDDGPLEGEYLNMGADNRYATAMYHEQTYGNYGSDNVQKSAEPLYWKTKTKQVLNKKQESGNYYIHYYILRISWDDTVQNNKETDMIYLMAK